MVMALKLLHPFLPSRWQLNPAERIASALLESALSGKRGVHTVTSKHLR